jgi:hypothetical protein
MWKAKKAFKVIVEQRFCSGNPRQAREGLNAMMGRESKREQ